MSDHLGVPAFSESPRARVCVLGSLNMDLVVRAPRFPRRGENIIGSAFDVFPGGKGANQAVAAARLGAEVSMIGSVGEDDYGREFLRVLTADGVDTRHIGLRSDARTGVGLIVIDDSPEAAAENTIIVALGANLRLSAADIDAARPCLAAADVLLMQLETPLETIAHAAAIARDQGATVILNAAPAGPVPGEILANVDILIVNEYEGAAVCGGPLRLDDPRSLADQLGAVGPECVVLTRGERGAFASLKGMPTAAEAFQVEAIDTVGAGDAFSGAFAVRWAEQQVHGDRDSMSLLDAMCWGSAAGALAVTKPGAIPSLPRRAEVAMLLRRHRI